VLISPPCFQNKRRDWDFENYLIKAQSTKGPITHAHEKLLYYKKAAQLQQAVS
jgi:hypothetical protein